MRLHTESGLSEQVGHVLIDEKEVLAPLVQLVLEQLPMLLAERSIRHGHDADRVGEMVDLAAYALGANGVDDERLDVVGVDVQLLLQQLERQLFTRLGHRHERQDAHLVHILLVIHLCFLFVCFYFIIPHR